MKFNRTIATLTAAAFLLSACGRPNTLTDPVSGVTKEYPTYGLLNQNTSKSERVCYEISVGNVLWSIILMETIIFPIYFIGFSLFNPVSAKTNKGCGIDQ
jgi:hypothetical protein